MSLHSSGAQSMALHTQMAPALQEGQLYKTVLVEMVRRLILTDASTFQDSSDINDHTLNLSTSELSLLETKKKQQ